jgi:hypothetical protein
MNSAVFSPDGRYRYLLTRQVGSGPGVATFIMLNPSTADGENDDPTIRKCVGFARQWGCGRLQVVNLFALRATDPSEIAKADDPVGPENADHLQRAIEVSSHPREPACPGPLVCAWGVRGAYRGQDLRLLGWLERFSVRPYALSITKDGHPRHPLYVSYSTRLLPFARQPRRMQAVQAG